MELYLEDWDFLPYGDSRLLHWELPRGVEEPPSSARRRRRRPGVTPRRPGVLITIAPTTPEEPAMVERVCDNPQEVVNVIGEFSNLTLLFINCHSIDAQGRSDAGERSGVCGILLGGARIYATHLPLFEGIRSSFSQHTTDQLVAGLVHTGFTYLSAPATSEAPVDWRITAEGFNQTHHFFVPRIVMRSCSIGQDPDFCQRLADAAGTYVFAPTIDQRYDQAGPWELHGPIRVFIPSSLAHLYRQFFTLRRDLSPGRQRLGQQLIATGIGRGVGRRRSPIGYA